jgi:hypothetical protein
LIQQAKNAAGEWQDIELIQQPICGSSYHDVHLAPKQFQIYSAALYKGKFETKLRMKLMLNDNEAIYSNEYAGRINESQFVTKTYDGR